MFTPRATAKSVDGPAAGATARRARPALFIHAPAGGDGFPVLPCWLPESCHGPCPQSSSCSLSPTPSRARKTARPVGDERCPARGTTPLRRALAVRDLCLCRPRGGARGGHRRLANGSQIVAAYWASRCRRSERGSEVFFTGLSGPLRSNRGSLCRSGRLLASSSPLGNSIVEA